MEADSNDVGRTALAREERRYLEGGREPVHKILGQAAFCLEIRVVGRDLDERSRGDVRHGGSM